MNRFFYYCSLLVLFFTSSLNSLSASENTYLEKITECTASEPKSLCISPYGLRSSLLMALIGADGKTYHELNQLLHFKGFEKEHFYDATQDLRGLQLTSSNALFVDHDQNLLQSYQNLIQNQFKALITPLNFSDSEVATKLINDFVEAQTLGMLPNFLKPSDIDPRLKLLLVNALAFKGLWKTPFNETFQASKKDPSKKLPYLTQVQTLNYFEDKSVRIVELPIRKNDSSPTFNVLLFVPQERSENPLKLAASYFSKITNIPFSKKHIDLTFPKFSLSHKQEFKPNLKHLGLITPFSDRADFSKINGHTNLYISRILQKVKIDFTAQGLSATAASATFINLKSCLPRNVELKLVIDKPFAFALFDYDHEICLFEGQYYPQ